MIKIIGRSFFSTFLIVASFFCLTPEPARAGVILCPMLEGIVWRLMRVHLSEPVLLALDANGNVLREALERDLSRTYEFIDDREVATGLAQAIAARAEATPRVEGKRRVTLTRDEIIQIIEPSGLGERKPAEVNQLMKDLM
jgi:hypothetical protein